MKTTVITQSGSAYTISQEGAKFFLEADNVPNPMSGKIEGRWEVGVPSPWPPVEGLPLFIPARTDIFWDREHPERIPGGGKHTSPVVEVYVDE